MSSATQANSDGSLSTVVGAEAVFSTGQAGQVVITVTGTPVQLSATSQVLQNGLSIQYTSITGSGSGTQGYSSSLTNVITGSGNGKIIRSGATIGVPAGVNLNTIYVNGVAGDIFDFTGN